MKPQDTIYQYLADVQKSFKPTTADPNIYQVSINIVEDFTLLIKGSVIRSRNTKIKLTGTLLHQNGQPVQISPLYKDIFIDKLNCQQNDFSSVKGTFVYDYESHTVNFIAKIPFLSPSQLSFESVRIAFEHLWKKSKQIELALESGGLKKSSSSNFVKIKSIQRKYRQRALKIIKGVEPAPSFEVFDAEESPLVEVAQLTEMDQIQEEKQLKKKQQKFLNYEIKTLPQQKKASEIDIEEKQSPKKKASRGGFCQVTKKTVKVQWTDKELSKPTLMEMAVKNFRKHKNNSDMKFKNEQRILSEIQNNKYLINYFKIKSDTTFKYMEYVDYTLTDYIYNKPYITIAQIIKVCIQLLESILILHYYHVVHRDLKPSNFLVQNTQTGIKLKVIDFGESTLRSDQYTEEVGKTLGCTLPYSPIECATMGKQGFNEFQIDYWSIGIIFYELLNKKTPVSYSRCFSQDIAKSWVYDFYMPICKQQKNGVRLIEEIFNMICFKMIRIKQNERMDLNQALSAIQLCKQFLNEVSSF